VSDRAPDAGSVSEADVATFEVARTRLFGIAYRVLGGAAEAEDVVQDAWIRWHGTNRREVRDAPAFLATATKRLAINVADSARARHEAPSGAWLPEPVDVAADPAVGVERTDELELAVRALLEKLSPTERAVYVLREGFDYPYRRIAELLELSEANARQLLVRARARLGGKRRRPVPRDEHRRLFAAFSAASQTGDLARLEQLLAGDVVVATPLPAAA
jgi:RNA polymerase sigma-70 factor (ECF subfamily)